MLMPGLCLRPVLFRPAEIAASQRRRAGGLFYQRKNSRFYGIACQPAIFKYFGLITAADKSIIHCHRHTLLRENGCYGIRDGAKQTADP